MQDDPTRPPHRSIAATSDLPGMPATRPRSDPGETLAPGAALADRYRLVAPLGKGGMGEVWRADDLVLGTSVALKFLPASVGVDPLRLERFRAEVRLARQVAHPNVCRVFDIGTAPGPGGEPRVFLSMEYIDGEDLASLLRRIGRLPQEKAIETARQICVGLAAAHEQGVIHRDLKPANVMIDGRGRARLTDFGLAALGDVGAGRDASAGTPLYMAPEQFAGVEATRRSDLYALGLVLYELFTGRPAHEVGHQATLADLRRLHDSGSSVTNPSALVPDLDPIVERVILRCLARDPQERPGSAIAVAAALPGGDPLAAALAAGEMPSPEMVAESGDSQRISRTTVTWVCGVSVLAALLVVGVGAWVSVLRFVPITLSTEVLESKAREVVATLGYGEEPADTAAGFDASNGYMRHLAETDSSPERWQRLRAGSPAAVYFWYRQSPTRLVPTSAFDLSVGLADPPPFLVGSLSVLLDTRGRLIGFDAVPPSTSVPDGAPDEPKWSAAFEAAGLDIAKFAPAIPRRSPWHASDRRAAWTGVYAEDPTVPLRVEAAAEGGRITSFRLLPPWSSAERTVTPTRDWSRIAFRILDQGVLAATLVMGLVLAWWNLRAGRGDWRAALRLGGIVTGIMWTSAALSAEHLSAVIGGRTLGESLAMALWYGTMCAALYLALEPVVRRLWPQMLVSWARLQDGRLRDARVGRDLLLGGATGLVTALVFRAILASAWIMPGATAWPRTGDVSRIEGPRIAVAELLNHAGFAVLISLAATFFLAGARRVLSRDWAAMLALGTLIGLLTTLEEAISTATVVIGILNGLVHVTVLQRLGSIGFMTTYFTVTGMMQVPCTLDLAAWYAPSTLAVLGVVLAPTAYGAAVCFRAARPAAGMRASPG